MATNSLRRTTNLFARAETVLMLIAPLLLFCFPVNWLGSGHTLCLFKNIFGRNCPGCGMTHAIISALHLHFADAWHYNKLVVVVLPLLAYLWGKEFIKIIPKG